MFVLFMIQELDVQLLFLPAASSLGSLLIIAEMILDVAQQMGFSDIVVLTHEGGANSDERQEVEMELDRSAQLKCSSGQILSK